MNEKVTMNERKKKFKKKGNGKRISKQKKARNLEKQTIIGKKKEGVEKTSRD